VKLHISPQLSFPLDFVTQTQAILAKKRVGKSYTAAVEAEELLKAKQQIVIIDPTGAHWGLKSSADGKHPGFPIAVFGGEHADVPLEESAGETIAQAIVEQHFSAIIDLTLFRKGQINRFMTPFLETLYRLNRQAMHLFVDEADAIAPQKPFGEEARMLGAMEDVVRRGGIRGIGTTLITQRPAVLNKNVLTQCEILCAMRIVHHKDIDAIHEWIEVHGDPDIADKMIASLPSLPIGTAWFWSPGWGDIFEKVEIRKRETFDSGATPKAGERKQTAKVLASVDLEQLGQQIQATVQRAKENDPKALRAEIAKLRKELQKPAAVAPKAQPIVNQKAIDRAVQAAIAPLGKQIGQMQKQTKQAMEHIAKGTSLLQEVANFAILGNIEKLAQVAVMNSDYAPRTIVPSVPRPRPATATPINGDGGELTGPERKIMRALGELLSIGKDTPPKNMVAAWAGYSPIGGAFGNPIGALRSKGLIDYPQPGTVALTDAGRAKVGQFDAPDQEEIWRRIEATCSGPEQKILRALLDNAGPNEMSKVELAEKAGYSPIGGAFGNPIGALRTKGLLDYPRQGLVQAADWLFLN
jgi:uncharacterized protein